jgi:hypothetical protein
MRYVVVDLSRTGEDTQSAEYPRTVLDTFNTMESAKALVLQRMAYGDVTVVVIDAYTGRQVFPDPQDTPRSGKPISQSGTRPAVPTPNGNASTRTKPRG